jgi:hypothetical protein
MCLVAGAWAQGFPEVKDWGAVRITIVHGGCLGPCPAYSVGVLGTGEVPYSGAHNVAIRGAGTRTITRAEVEEIVSELRRAQFFSLQNEYQADSDQISATVVINEVTKTVGYSSGSATLQAVSSLEERLVHGWVRGDVSAVGELKSGGFAFRSQAGGELLARVALRGDIDAVRALIAEGCPVNVRAGDSLWTGTPLEAAVSNENAEVLRVLIAAGVSRDDQDAKNRALFLSILRKNTEAAQRLREYGARD